MGKTRFAILALASSLLFAFLGPLELPAEENQAICAVCGPREGSGFEPIRARATYIGGEYAFCSLKCKVEFLKDPEAFLRTEKGTPAPTLNLSRLDGSGTVSLADFQRRVVLLDFWATFCAPCVKALPELQALHEKYATQGFTVIGIMVDDRTSLAQKLTKKAEVNYPLLKSTPQIWREYKINTLPSLVLVGRDGRIVRRFGGEADKQGMIAEIEDALGAKGQTAAN